MTDIFSLTGSKALVTGGSRGIGAGIVELFSRQGAEVAFCHFKDEANANALVTRLTKDGLKVHAIACDVASETDVAAMTAWAEECLGEVNVVVNCAGIGGDKPFTDLSLADWDRMIAVHLRGTYLVTHAFFGKMIKRSYGRVINISSQLAYKGSPGLVHYSAAKAGILGFTRALAYEGAPYNVTVNAVAPGPIDTELTRGMTDEFLKMKKSQVPLGRFGRVEEIAPTLVLLASEGGSFYTGQCLSPNGGDVMI